MQVFVWLGLFLTAISAAPPISSRIIGGSVTTINNYPSVAAVLVSIGGNFRQNCGGSILNQRSILTAANCIYVRQPGLYRFRVGSSYANSGGVVYNVASLIIHPNWNSLTNDNDVTILRSASNINFSNVIQTASIAGPNYVLGDHQAVWAVGWGATVAGGVWSEQLRHVQIWTINQAICNQRYHSKLTVNMLCAGLLDQGGRGQCLGDNGGPLYHNGVVVGISSFSNGCGHLSYPGVNARVSSFTGWIQANA